MNKPAVIILAAGLSSRINAFKPLLEVGGITLTDRLISVYQDNGLDVILVAGWRKDDLRAGIKSKGIKTVENPDFQQGMFTSVQAGVRELGNHYSAFFIHPVDIPLVRSYTVKLLIEAHSRHPELVIYPVFKGKRGHPVLLPFELAPTTVQSRTEGGLKAVLDTASKRTFEVNTADRHILFDVDTMQDYQELQERFLTYEIPTNEECKAILIDLCSVSEKIYKHGQKVAEAAQSIAKALKERGISIDIEAVRAGALVHDIAKGQKKHDIAGGELLREMGFGKVGEIVAVHTHISSLSISWESKIVYLADKLVKGTRRVTLAQRYDPAERPFTVTPEIMALISARRKRAEEVKTEIETILGFPIEKITF